MEKLIWPESYINKIINSDCLEVMKQMPDKCVDLVVTSPPYDDMRDYENPVWLFESVAEQIYRIVKEGGVLVWIVGDATNNGNETGSSFNQALHFKKIGFNLHDTMIYEKQEAFIACPKRYNQCFEYMFIFSKGKINTVNLIKDRKNLYKNGKHHGTRRQKDGSLKPRVMTLIKEFGARKNIWCYGAGRGKSTDQIFAHEHPAIFPEKLAADHIKSWSNKRDLVLDPMNGSGTTTKMAKQLGRKFIGIEISEKYCQLARDRLRQGVLI